MSILHQNTAYSKRTSNRSIPLFVAGRDRPVAFADPSAGLLYKTVADGRKHFLKIPPGIGFDDGVLEQASILGCTDIAVTDGATGDVYRCTLQTFLAHCETIDRGFGRQLCLRFTWWGKNGQPSEMDAQRAAAEAKAATAEVRQMELFA